MAAAGSRHHGTLGSVRPVLVALLVVAAMPVVPARGEPREEPPPRPDLCGRGVRHHGAAIDLDVKGADLQDVFRLIADAGRVNVVVPDEVSGKVTLRLVRVAWDAVACAVAKLHHLTITVDDNILVVTRAREQRPAPVRR
jgi:hypothetical protein